MKQHCNYTWLEITSYVLYNDSSERQTMKSLKLYTNTALYKKELAEKMQILLHRSYLEYLSTFFLHL